MKKSRISMSPPSRSSEIILSINIDHLPDLLLVEILCRLPCPKLIFQCKCVSKRWFRLISDPYFVRRSLLSVQFYKPNKPIKNSVAVATVFSRESETRLGLGYSRELETSVFSLKNLPCFQLNEIIPVLVGNCNGLILCCATSTYQRDYYICNPKTKQWVALPPTPQVYETVGVGFICDPYYTYDGIDDHGRKEEKVITSAGCSDFVDVQVNGEYRWRVARIVPNSWDPKFHVEIFSSETGKWRELVVLSSKRFFDFCYHWKFRGRLYSSSGVAYNGKLYWVGYENLGYHYHRFFTFELDPFSNTSAGDDIIDKCRVIEFEEGLQFVENLCVGVCKGRLRASQIQDQAICVWEFREDHQVVDGDAVAKGKFSSKWCLINKVPLDKMLGKKVLQCRTDVVGFHPNSGDDIVYVQDRYSFKITICNLDKRTSVVAAWSNGFNSRATWFPFVLPLWPTPVPIL